MCSRLKNEEVIHLIQTNWIPFTTGDVNHVASHFSQNLSRIKSLLKDWAKQKKEAEDQPLKHVELDYVEIHNSEDGGFISQQNKEKESILEYNRNKLLKEKEEV